MPASTAVRLRAGDRRRQVAIVDASTFQLISAVTGSTTNPYGIAATPDGTEVWVTESGTNIVSVVSTSSNSITSTIPVGIYPHGIAITPDGKTAYVANTGPNTGPGGSYVVSIVDVASQTVDRHGRRRRGAPGSSCPPPPVRRYS